MELNYSSQIGVLRGLLISSREMYFPTIDKFILSEVANGAIDYIGGEANKIKHADNLNFLGDFENKLWKHYSEEMQKHGENLSADLKQVLGSLIKPTRESNSPPEKGGSNQTDLYVLWKNPLGGICPVFGRSTFSLPYSEIVYGQNFLQTLDDGARKSIVNIGEKMKKFIQEDIIYIRNNYQW